MQLKHCHDCKCCRHWGGDLAQTYNGSTGTTLTLTITEIPPERRNAQAANNAIPWVSMLHNGGVVYHLVTIGSVAGTEEEIWLKGKVAPPAQPYP